jgi:hypothetical protein
MRNSSFKRLAINRANFQTENFQTSESVNNVNIYSPIKSVNSDDNEKLSESNPYLTTTATASTTSYDLWLDSYQSQSNKLFSDDCMLKSITNSDSSERLNKLDKIVFQNMKEYENKSTNESTSNIRLILT